MRHAKHANFPSTRPRCEKLKSPAKRVRGGCVLSCSPRERGTDARKLPQRMDSRLDHIPWREAEKKRALMLGVFLQNRDNKDESLNGRSQSSHGIDRATCWRFDFDSAPALWLPHTSGLLGKYTAKGVHYQAALTPGAFPSLEDVIRFDRILDGRDETSFSFGVASSQQKSEQVQRLQVMDQALAKIRVRGISRLGPKVLFRSKPIHGRHRFRACSIGMQSPKNT